MREFVAGDVVSYVDMNRLRDNILALEAGGEVLIGYSLAGSDVAEFDINPIEDGYPVWHIFAMLRGTTAATEVASRWRLNNNSTAGNYAAQHLLGSGATPASARDTTNATICSAFPAAANALSNMFTPVEMKIFNCNDSGKLKLAKFDMPYVPAAISSIGSLWGHGVFTVTTVLSRLQVVPAAGNWLAGSWVAVLGKQAEEL
jgi:hypothetical protein